MLHPKQTYDKCVGLTLERFGGKLTYEVGILGAEPKTLQFLKA